MALVTPRSSNRAIFAPYSRHIRATSAPACSGRSKWRERGRSFAVSGLCRAFLEAEPRRNPKNSEATDLPFTSKRFTPSLR